MSKNTNTIKAAVLSIFILGLTACGGGGKKVVTVDDSADYKSSTSLPPLKKPSRVLSPNANAQIEPIADNKTKLEKVEDTVVLTEPGVASEPTETASEQTTSGVDATNAKAETSSPESSASIAPATDASIASDAINSRVISGEAENSRLEIDADFDAAWAYVSKNLKSSDITVFSRNKAAGRFSIGCGAMESVQGVKKGGWSFFNKSKQRLAEYCALSVVERRGKSLVFVLNRDDTEVSSEYSNPLFTRILNN